METPSCILAWKIPGAEEPGGLQSMGRKEPGTTEHAQEKDRVSHAELILSAPP